MFCVHLHGCLPAGTLMEFSMLFVVVFEANLKRRTIMCWVDEHKHEGHDVSKREILTPLCVSSALQFPSTDSSGPWRPVDGNATQPTADAPEVLLKGSTCRI